MDIQDIPKHFANYAKSEYKFFLYKKKWGVAAPSRYKTILVTPDAITHATAPPLHQSHSIFGTHVVAGNWDQPKSDASRRGIVPFKQWSDTYRSIKKHYEDGMPWKETPKYQSDISKFSEQFAKKRIKKIQELYNSIKTKGYKSQKELIGRRPFYAYRLFPSPNFREVVINIGRDGDFIFEDGKHRFSLAKLLNLDEIPVRILARHRKWQQVRDEVINANSISELSDKAKEKLRHPDLTNLVQKNPAIAQSKAHSVSED